MKTILFFFILCLCHATTGLAQRQYGETLPLQNPCPCEMMKFIKSRQDMDVWTRPFNMSRNCYFTIPATVSPDDVYFFKKRKRKTKPHYPKKSHIISIVRD